MKLTVGQAVDIELEILGFTAGDVKVPGLLNEKLPMKTKYWLKRLVKKLSESRKDFFEAEKELFVSLGAEEVDGKLIIKQKLEDGSDNPAIEELNKQRNALLSEKIYVGDIKFDINDFTFEDEMNAYQVFMEVAFE